MIWDFQQPQQNVSNHPFYSHIVPAETAPPLQLSVGHLKAHRYRLKVFRTGFRANDVYSAYIDMGAPKSLTPEQLAQLSSITRDLPEVDRIVHVRNNGAYHFSIPMHTNDVVLVTIEQLGK